MELVFNPLTETAISDYLRNPAQSLLIEGAEGSGKGTLCIYLGAEVLKIPESKLTSYPYYLHIETLENTISIDSIRRAQQFMLLKTLGKNNIRRVLVVDQAERMTIEAQNAFLKLLEEPPKDTIIILSVINAMTLLPTIRSRTQTIHIRMPVFADLQTYFSQRGFSVKDIIRAHHISEGRMGLMKSILDDENNHPLLLRIETAKHLLKANTYDRLKRVDELSKNKTEAAPLLQALALVCRAALVEASKKAQVKNVKRWHHSLEIINDAETAIKMNPNMKLFMTDLLLNL